MQCLPLTSLSSHTLFCAHFLASFFVGFSPIRIWVAFISCVLCEERQGITQNFTWSLNEDRHEEKALEKFVWCLRFEQVVNITSRCWYGYWAQAERWDNNVGRRNWLLEICEHAFEVTFQTAMYRMWWILVWCRRTSLFWSECLHGKRFFLLVAVPQSTLDWRSRVLCYCLLSIHPWICSFSFTAPLYECAGIHVLLQHMCHCSCSLAYFAENVLSLSLSIPFLSFSPVSTSSLPFKHVCCPNTTHFAFSVFSEGFSELERQLATKHHEIEDYAKEIQRSVTDTVLLFTVDMILTYITNSHTV